MKKKIVIGLLIFLVVVAMVVISIQKNSGGESKISFGSKKVYDVEAKTIEAIPIESTVIVTGRVEEVNKKDLILPSQVVIEKWLVKKGDTVKKGDQLMEVDLSSLEEQLEQLQMSKEEQSLQLKKLKSMTNSGDTTSIEISIELAKINLESANALYSSLQAIYAKNEVLYKEGIISESELDGYSKQLSDALSQVTVAELNLKRSEAELASYQKSITDSQQSTSVDIDIQNKRLEEIDFNIDNLTQEITELQEAMLCPMDGIITQINVTEGMLASAMQSILTIVDTNALKVVADVSEYDIKKIALNQKVKLSGDATLEDADISGIVNYIDPIAVKSIASGKEATSVTIELSITSGSEYLKPGYTLECEITTEAKDQATVASYDMFKEDKDGSKYVYVIDENNVLRKQPVTLGIVSDFSAEILEGLEPGDRVVVNPSLILKEGLTVQVLEEVKE